MRFRPGLETLEPRCLLSVAPATDYLPSAAALLPSVPSFGRVPAPIIGLPTTPRNPYDWPPSVPENPPPIQSPPDYSDQGGPIDLGLSLIHI